MYRPMPVSVPPEPTPTTMASTSPSIWRRISGPVVISCASGLAGLANWFTKIAPGVRGHDEQCAIALAAAHQSEPEPGIAGRRLDDCTPGLTDHRPPPPRHRARGPVLERAGRVRALEFEKQPTGAAIDAGDLDERRIADEVEDRCHDDL